MMDLTKEQFIRGFKIKETCRAFDLKGARAINIIQHFFFFDDMEKVFGKSFVDSFNEDKQTTVEINEENRYKTITVFKNGTTLMIDAKQNTFMDFEYEIEFSGISNEGEEFHGKN